MPVFCVPADFKMTSVSEFSARNQGWDIPVAEVYGSVRTSKFGSGRRPSVLPEVGEDDFGAYLRHCQQRGMEYNYTLNFSCLDNREFTEEGRKELIDYLTGLVDKGVSRFTVALPTVVGLLSQLFPEIPVTVSVIASVDTVNKAEYWCRFPNVKCIYVMEAINRQTGRLKAVANYCHDHGVQVGTIVNCSCFQDCPMRMMHYNFESHSTAGCEYIVPAYYGSVCAIDKYTETEKFLSAPWIRPEDLDRYAEMGMDRFKLAGREFFSQGGDMLRTVDVYNSRSWDGDLVDLHMCFANNKYSQVLTIPNSERLAQYLDTVLSGKLPCDQQACSTCDFCKINADLVQVDEEAKARWTSKFQGYVTTLYAPPEKSLAA